MLVFFSFQPDVNLGDLKGKTALYFAAQMGSTSMWKALLDCQASPSITDSTGKTPLNLVDRYFKIDQKMKDKNRRKH
jgi:hypothetical protein